eukprot:TRINITY_DN67051_c0_g1_i1.p1 TRINITY_DN67051_c0_g1~~TRINITY_DN67051_c0_g1_i1.p1  ORF type:complete len:127 (-),score=45.79 TRINITY_DN67051_c0_g1_i1:188-568(-)
MSMRGFFFFFQAEDGIRDVERSRGLGDVYKRQVSTQSTWGGGKIPVMPQYLLSIGENKVILRNYEGGLFVYEEPKNYSAKANPKGILEENKKSRDGVASMLTGDRKCLIPSDTKRLKRATDWKKDH